MENVTTAQKIIIEMTGQELYLLGEFNRRIKYISPMAFNESPMRDFRSPKISWQNIKSSMTTISIYRNALDRENKNSLSAKLWTTSSRIPISPMGFSSPSQCVVVPLWRPTFGHQRMIAESHIFAINSELKRLSMQWENVGKATLNQPLE